VSVAVPLWVPSALAGILLIALAGALLVLDRRQLATRAFAVLLVLRALGTIARAFQTSPSFTIDAAASLVFPATAACSAFGGLYFVLVYPRRRTWIGRSPYGWVALAIPAAALAIFILARPDLYAILAPDPAGGARLVSAGPLFGFLPLAFITTCAFALVFAWEYARAPRTSGRSVLLLVSLAFALEAVVTSLMYVVADVAGTLRPVPGVYGRLQAIDFEIGFLPLLLLVAVLLRARAQDGDTRREVPLALAALGLAALSAVATVVVTGSLDLTAPQPQHRGYLIGMWRLAFPLLVAYALLQHRLFDIDLKIKWTIKRGTLAAIFIAVFFVAAQVAQNLFSESYGVWIGGVAAGGRVVATGRRRLPRLL